MKQCSKMNLTKPFVRARIQIGRLYFSWVKDFLGISKFTWLGSHQGWGYRPCLIELHPHLFQFGQLVVDFICSLIGLVPAVSSVLIVYLQVRSQTGEKRFFSGLANICGVGAWLDSGFQFISKISISYSCKKQLF